MTTFYDYDMVFTNNDNFVYALRANGKKLPNGGYCKVMANGSGWTRKTNWLAKWGHGGIRYEYYNTLDDALFAGIRWARRREREDEREKVA